MQESSFLGMILEDINFFSYRDPNGVSSANAMDYNTGAVPGQFTHDASVPFSFQPQEIFTRNGEFSSSSANSNRPNHGNRDQPHPMMGHPSMNLFRSQLLPF